MTDNKPSGADRARKSSNTAQPSRGGTDRIRDALRDSPGNFSELAQRTGLPRNIVRSLVSTMLNKTGGITVIGLGKNRQYALYDSPEGRAELQKKAPKTTGPFAMPTRPERETGRELRRDPFAHMRLALAGRR